MAGLSGLTIRFDKAAMDRVVTGSADRAVQRAAQHTRDRAKTNLTAAGRIDTGRLRDSIRAYQVRPGAYQVRTGVPYASFQEHGIGPVRPVKAKVLRFKPKGSSVYIFRPRTKGFPGAHYLRDAYRALTLRDFLP